VHNLLRIHVPDRNYLSDPAICQGFAASANLQHAHSCDHPNKLSFLDHGGLFRTCNVFGSDYLIRRYITTHRSAISGIWAYSIGLADSVFRSRVVGTKQLAWLQRSGSHQHHVSTGSGDRSGLFEPNSGHSRPFYPNSVGMNSRQADSVNDSSLADY
jgi:hypothetical protein